MKLLRQLCEIHAPSGEEVALKTFILDYVNKSKKNWVAQPEIYHGDNLQDCVILKFGNPRTAVFAHMDSVGFTVRYHDQLVPIGGPEAQSGFKLVGRDSLGEIACELEVNKENQPFYKFGRAIETGTSLTFECKFSQDEEYITSCSIDNRLGVFNALKLAETLKDGVIVFSSWEEHGGGSVPFLAKFIAEKWSVHQALISDITWVTDGVQPGLGVVISMRDRNIPRKSYVDKIISIAEKNDISYQIEVEGSGSSDGRELQESPYPFDWCFVGAPEQNVHSPFEKVHLDDIASMLAIYQVLMKEL